MTSNTIDPHLTYLFHTFVTPHASVNGHLPLPPPLPPAPGHLSEKKPPLLDLLLDQRKLILWMKMHRSNNIVLQTVSELLATCSKNGNDVSDMSENIIEQTMWNMFSYSLLYSVDADF